VRFGNDLSPVHPRDRSQRRIPPREREGSRFAAGRDFPAYQSQHMRKFADPGETMSLVDPCSTVKKVWEGGRTRKDSDKVLAGSGLAENTDEAVD
jgi:hypothetical protein